MRTKCPTPSTSTRQLRLVRPDVIGVALTSLPAQAGIAAMTCSMLGDTRSSTREG